MNKRYQEGQILLIVVLVMVTALTVSLSVAARSITNIRTSQDAASSEKAFSAAEAGIEKALTNSQSSTGTFVNNTSYKTTVATVAGREFPLNNGAPVLKDAAADVWLSTYPTYATPWTGDLTFYWGTASDVCNQNEAVNTLAALEIIVLSGTTANPQIQQYGVDPCSGRSLNNKFQYIAPGGGTIAGRAYQFRKTIAINNGLYTRVIPLYAPAMIAVKGCNFANTNCNTLPSQGSVIQSVGVSSNTKRKIITYRYYPQLPAELFQYNLFLP